jgi:hypothetical protein
VMSSSTRKGRRRWDRLELGKILRVGLKLLEMMWAQFLVCDGCIVAVVGSCLPPQYFSLVGARQLRTIRTCVRTHVKCSFAIVAGLVKDVYINGGRRPIRTRRVNDKSTLA